MLMLLTIGVHVSYLTSVLPAILVFSLGLSITVAPLTAAILAGVHENEAGIGSAVNNAVARVAGLIATVTVGALVAAQFSASLDQQPRTADRSRQAGKRRWPKPSGSRWAGRRSRGVPPREAVAITAASDAASLDAFRLGIGVAGGSSSLGGLIGAAGIRNPRRVVRAEHCSGGQLAGAPLDAAGLHASAT